MQTNAETKQLLLLNRNVYATLTSELLFPLLGGYFLGNSLSRDFEIPPTSEWKSETEGFKRFYRKPKRGQKSPPPSSNGSKILLFAPSFFFAVVEIGRTLMREKDFSGCQMYL